MPLEEKVDFAKVRVGQGNPATADSVSAVALLREGEIVDWEPGDGTRYEVELIPQNTRYGRPPVLLVHNFRCTIPAPTGMGYIDLTRFLSNRAVPAGSWAGMRPLLVQLGWTKRMHEPVDGPVAYDARYARDEAEARARRPSYIQTDGQYTDRQRSRDQALGRLVREAVEMQGEGTPPPTEEV